MSEAFQLLSIDELSILELSVTDDLITAKISDGRIVSIPVAWFPRLRGIAKEKLEKI